MKRWLFDFAAGMSAILLLLTVASGFSSSLRLNIVWGNPDNGTGYWVWLEHGQLNFRNARKANILQQAFSGKSFRPGEAGNGFDFIGIHDHRISAIAYPKQSPSPTPDAFVENFQLSEPWTILLFSILAWPGLWILVVRGRTRQ